MNGPDGELRDRIALVTGGGRGLGATIARRLAAAGAEVWLGYRSDTASAEATRATIEAAGGRARLARADLAHPKDVRELAARLERLDLLVHGAALGSFKPTLEVRPGQWDLSLHVGSRALLLLARALANRLEEAHGAIVALSSLGGRRVVGSYGAIGIDKAALEATVRYLAAELGPRGIRVNAVAAGAVEDGSLHLHPRAEELFEETRRRARLLEGAEVAEVVLFLAGSRSSAIQGQTIVCDAGLTLTL